MRNKPLTIGVVGAGRVGATLATALAAAGHRVVVAAGRSAASRRRIAHQLSTLTVLPADRVAARAELLLLSVPDDALAGLVAAVAGSGADLAGRDLGSARGADGGYRAVRRGQIVAHTSGAYGLGVLAPVVAAGARPLALHPAMTFTGTDVDVDRLAAGVSFGVTAPDDLRPLATRLVADLGGTVEWVPEQRRELYHAALAHGANHLVTLVNEAADRLRDAGVADPARVLDPLLRAALENALHLGDAALTGPVSRGDAGTVARHLAVLAVTAPESVPPYLALARRTADRAIAAGLLPATDVGPLLDVMAGTRAGGQTMTGTAAERPRTGTAAEATP
jgi:predicted short-subunit dehydrogenase-like oxidoreductase (DUF2520 family)